MLTSVHAVAAEMVVAVAEIWLATKVFSAVLTLSAAAAIATTSRLAIVINATIADAVAISVAFFS